MTEKTVVYDMPFTPRVTLTRTAAGGYRSVIEVTELNPTRATTAEERGAGIESLNPPTVRIEAYRAVGEGHRALIDTSIRAVLSAIRATSPDETPVHPADLLSAGFRVALGMRGALRLLDDESI